jgi:preprotein translocase subunit SecE
MSKIQQAVDGTRNFVTEVQVELKKCAWPTRTELFESTVVVIVAVGILGVVVGFSDVIMMAIMRMVIR